MNGMIGWTYNDHANVSGVWVCGVWYDAHGREGPLSPSIQRGERIQEDEIDNRHPTASAAV